MGIIEILLISIGLSFDVFVVHICVGAGFSRKHGKDTLLSSLIFGGDAALCTDPGKCCCRYSEAGQKNE